MTEAREITLQEAADEINRLNRKLSQMSIELKDAETELASETEAANALGRTCQELRAKLEGADKSYAKQVALTARFVFEKEKYRNALEFILSLEPGSRGAYSKFAEAQARACEALKPTDAKGAINGQSV